MIDLNTKASFQSPQIGTPTRNSGLWQLSQSMESTFLSEMLSSTGLGTTPDSFGGGIGEGHFSSFLTKAYADAMVTEGGIGLAQSIYNSLVNSGELNVEI